MLEEFNFHQTQMEYIKAAQLEIPTYLPFGKTATEVGTMIADCGTVRAAYLTKLALRNTARGELQMAAAAAHAACVSVYAIMKSVYAPDGSSLRAIRSLPKRDSSPGQTLVRAEATAKLWAELPNPPGAATPFVAGTLTLAAFQVLVTELAEKRGTVASCDQQFQMKEGALHVCDRENVTFITGALVQGRAQFAPGTAEREVIDAIPTEPAQQAPLQAVISLAESTAPGNVHLQFDAAHATSFQVWQKGPGQPAFVQVAEVIRPGSGLPGEYSATGLASGAYEYQVVGVNSRGEGPASEPSAVAIGAPVPGQAFITFIESPEAGAVGVYYEAVGATSFQVWHKAPGESIFTQVDTTLSGEYTAFGLPGGMHAYKVVPVNAAGAGPASEPETMDVAAEAAA